MLVDAQPDMAVVGEAGDGELGVAAVLALRPDVVLLDLAMPRLGGLEALPRMRAAHPAARILALTAHARTGTASKLLEAGVAGVMSKETAADDLVRAVRLVAEGGIYVDARTAGEEPAAPTGRGVELSGREAEVLRLIAEGHALKDIAARLSVSTRTLETYRARGMEKLGLTSRAELVRHAVRCGWFERG